MKQEKEKRNFGILWLVLVLLIVLVAILYLQSTRAQYRTTGSGNGTVEVAKWNVQFSSDGSIFQDTLDMEFDPEDNANVVEGKIAPGINAAGTGIIRLTETETSVKYYIEVGDISSLPIDFEVVDVTVGGTPLSYEGPGRYSGEVALSGNSAMTDADDVVFEVLVEWTDDTDFGETDTPFGIAGQDIIIPVTVTVEQLR